MASPKMISFTSPDADLQRQQMQLQRRQKMAEALQAQANTPLQGQTVSDGAGRQREVPISAFQTISKLLQSGLSAYAGKKADESQTEFDTQTRELGAQQQRAKQAEMKALAQALAGKPAQYDAPEERGMQGPTFSAPAQAPDRNKALALALQSEDPGMQKIGGDLLKESMQKPKYSTTPQYDQQGRAFVLNDQGDAPKYLDGVAARDKMENVNGVWQNPYQQGNNSFAPQDPNKPFGMGPNGVVPNQAYQNYEMGKAKAGAPNVSVRTEMKAAESIAKEVGPILKDSAIAAQGAMQQIDAAQRVVQAVDSNKIFAGPLASKRMAMTQVADVLGVGGKDDAEKIANTRQVIRGLSELTLQGRKSMRGEGAITESEGKLAERAMSGDIDSLTPAELKQIANASARAAAHTVQDHNRKVGIAAANPATAGIAGYFQSTPIGGTPGVAPAAPSTPNPSGSLTPEELTELQALRKRLGR